MATAGKWEDLQDVKLHPSLVHALDNGFGFPTMTPVQAAAIPPLLSSKDVCVGAETGSGKTLSFLIPIAQTLLFSRDPTARNPQKAVRAIVLLPTRELASQVHAVAKTLFSGLEGNVVPVPLIGGAPAASGPGPDMEFAKDHRVLIATPGRLSAAISSGSLTVSKLEMLIMDEADRLLDMGFAVTVTDILTRLPKQRRTGMYSATQTSELEALARAGMRNPVRVVVRVQGRPGETMRKQRIPASLQCFFQTVSPRHKVAALLELLVRNPRAKVMVYLLTCACVDYLRRLPLVDLLGKVAERIDVDNTDSPKRKFVALHGKMTQKHRERNLREFAEREAGVLLCTDVAARGIDIADVDWVVQLDVPQDPDAYIHRVGRTGRLGREGRAVVFLGDWEDAYVDFLKVRKCDIREMGESGMDETLKEKVRDLVQKSVREATMADRAVLEASEKAFLSFVRAYKEHKCGYLLKLSDIDINSVIDYFGLLRLPRFHEFKSLRAKLAEREKSDVVVRDIAFKDKKRERRRQEEISEAIANRAQRREELQARSKKRKRKDKKGKKGEGIAEKSKKHGKATENRYVGGIGGADDGDEDDFSAEAMLLRKVKRGRLSREAFDKQVEYDVSEGEGEGEDDDVNR